MPSPWTGKPRRLERVFSAYDHPVYFVTCVTSLRQPLLDNPVAHESLVRYGCDNAEQGRAMGRYVLMPDHLHFLDRLLRNHERYGDTWAYIHENAPAAGRAEVPENWPYQGEIVVIRY